MSAHKAQQISSVITANKLLYERRAALAAERQKQAEAVRALIAAGRLEDARRAAEGLQGSPYWNSIIDMVRAAAPNSTCPACGSVCKAHVDHNTLELVNSYPCPRCRNRYRKYAIAEKREGFLAEFRSPASVRTTLEIAGVPARYLDAFGSKPQTWDGAASQVIDTAESFFIHGPAGCGKTMLAVAAMQAAIMRIEPRQSGCIVYVAPEQIPLFVDVPTLLLDVRDCLLSTTSPSDKAVILSCISRHMIVLDEFPAHNLSEWETQALYQIVHSRYQHRLRTIITSRYTIDDIRAKLSSDVAYRIEGMCRPLPLNKLAC